MKMEAERARPDPAPETVYKCTRPQWNSSLPIRYSIPVPSATSTVRLHFAETYFHGGDIGYQRNRDCEAVTSAQIAKSLYSGFTSSVGG